MEFSITHAKFKNIQSNGWFLRRLTRILSAQTILMVWFSFVGQTTLILGMLVSSPTGECKMWVLICLPPPRGIAMTLLQPCTMQSLSPEQASSQWRPLSLLPSFTRFVSAQNGPPMGVKKVRGGKNPSSWPICNTLYSLKGCLPLLVNQCLCIPFPVCQT